MNQIEIISRASKILSEARGIRTVSADMLEFVSETLGIRFGLICLRRREDDIAEIVASFGLYAPDYRRLESRISRTGLWRIFESSRPLKVQNISRDAGLDFLSKSRTSGVLIGVPVMLGQKSVGILSICFPLRKDVDAAAIIKLLEVLSSMYSLVIRGLDAESEETEKYRKEIEALRQELKQKYDFSQMIGNSNQMKQVYDKVAQLARSNVSVLLRGESGTGKELIANAIHYNSLRSKGPFIKVDCGSLPAAELGSALFEQAAHSTSSNAEASKGLIELADGGTLYIDKIDRMPPVLRSRLTAILENGVIDQLRTDETLPINVRLIAATDKMTDKPIDEDWTESVLYSRLSEYTIHVPPLKERKSDILLLAEHFLKKYEGEYNKTVRRISTPAIDMLTAYHFPGNVRELENVIESAVLACDSNVIHGHHLPPTLQTAEISATETRLSLASAVEAFENDLICDTLKSTRGNIAKAAKMLDSTERILGYKIKKYEIDAARYRR